MKLFIALVLLFSGEVFCKPKKTRTFVILGDSLVEGYGVKKEDSFPQVLQRALTQKFPNYRSQVIQAGISGSTSQSASLRLSKHLKKKPSAVLLGLGANDGLRGLPTRAMKRNLQEAITLALSQGVPVILLGMKLPLNYGSAYRAQFEQVYQDLTKENSLTLVPFLLEGVAARPEMNLDDGIHPNPRGHQRISRTVQPFLEVFYK